MYNAYKLRFDLKIRYYIVQYKIWAIKMLKHSWNTVLLFVIIKKITDSAYNPTKLVWGY